MTSSSSSQLSPKPPLASPQYSPFSPSPSSSYSSPKFPSSSLSPRSSYSFPTPSVTYFHSTPSNGYQSVFPSIENLVSASIRTQCSVSSSYFDLQQRPVDYKPSFLPSEVHFCVNDPVNKGNASYLNYCSPIGHNSLSAIIVTVRSVLNALSSSPSIIHQPTGDSVSKETASGFVGGKVKH